MDVLDPSLSKVGRHSFRHQRELVNPPHLYRPASADTDRAGGNRGKLHKIAKMLKRSNKESRSHGNGRVPIHPAFMDDYPDGRRSESPEAVFPQRSYSAGNKNSVKPRRGGSGGRDRDEPYYLWKPSKHKYEWESMSGRQLTLFDIKMEEMSKVEWEALQRLAIGRLQEMDVSVSYGMLKHSPVRTVFQRLSRRKLGAVERPGSAAVFGQPLVAVVSSPGQEHQTRLPLSPTHSVPPANLSLLSTPSPTTPPSQISPKPHPDQPVASPTDEPDTPEANATTTLLEQLAISGKAEPSLRNQGDSVMPMESLVPFIVRKTIQHLDSNGIKTEGIFRVPGSKARIDEIRKHFDSGEAVELTADTNPHDVACLLKEFFRSLPEPLMTRELYHPFLQTRKIAAPGSRRDAYRLLCLLLPHPNRDTLHALLQFLGRVALHSNDMILMDGTEESGNRMTEENLGTIFGPNILHNENRRKHAQGGYQVTKQDPEELTAVCRVMEELIRMQDSVFTIPKEVYDAALKNLFTIDHDSLDKILARKCQERMGALLSQTTCTWDEESMDMLSDSTVTVSRSQSTDCLNRVNSRKSRSSVGHIGSSRSSEAEEVWHASRNRSFSDVERSLEQAMKDLQEELSHGLHEELSGDSQDSSNDSAMGESECLTSPLQQVERNGSVPFTQYKDVAASLDSAFSTHSHNSSNEGVNFNNVESVVPRGSYSTPCSAHMRASSGISALSDSPAEVASPIRVRSPRMMRKNCRSNPEYSSMPVLTPEIEMLRSGSMDQQPTSPLSLLSLLRKTSSSGVVHGSSHRKSRREAKRSLDMATGSIENMPEYRLQRSPILGRAGIARTGTDPLQGVPTLSSQSASSFQVLSPNAFKNVEPRFNFSLDPSTECLI